MRAVNLIPPDAAGHSRASGSGFGSYVVLAVLALLIAMSATYTLAGRAVKDRERRLADVAAQADATEAKAARLKDFSAFANMRKARVETIKSLAKTRFDWAYALHEVARTLPSGSWITSLRATTSPGVAVDGASDSLRGALAAPAIELAGCARDHSGVAGTVASLRGISGVQRVSLSKSVKAVQEDASGSGDSAGAGDTSCGSRPQFSLTVFFEAPATNASSSTSTGGTTP